MPRKIRAEDGDLPTTRELDACSMASAASTRRRCSDTVAACHEWLERELRQVKPDVIVALGATALAAILGRRLAIAEARGRALQLPSGTPLVATYHPSAVL
jgi:uracil-DNA glycosylase family 4